MDFDQVTADQVPVKFSHSHMQNRLPASPANMITWLFCAMLGNSVNNLHAQLSALIAWSRAILLFFFKPDLNSINFTVIPFLEKVYSGSVELNSTTTWSDFGNQFRVLVKCPCQLPRSISYQVWHLDSDVGDRIYMQTSRYLWHEYGITSHSSLWDVISYQCLWYLLLAHRFSNPMILFFNLSTDIFFTETAWSFHLTPVRYHIFLSNNTIMTILNSSNVSSSN